MDESTQARVRNWLARAGEYLRAAEVECNAELYARSISTSYYAMFYAATAALASVGIDRARHSGLVSAFGDEFVRTGKMDRRLGRMLSRGMQAREASDYDEVPDVNESLASQRLDDARDFIAAISSYLTQHGLRT